MVLDEVVGGLLRDASIEVSPRDPAVAVQLADWFAAGTQVFINFLPGTDHAPTVAVAAALRRQGFEPVPHLTARSFAQRAELADTLARLRGEAAVERVLVIGGDVAVARGPFTASLDLIQTGLLGEYGIRVVGLAGYPEGHHTVAAETVARITRAKRAALQAQGLGVFFTTQFGFEAAPILQWLDALRASDPQVPVRIGIAGPASLRALLTFAMKCGIGTSLRVLLNQPQSIGRLLRDASPDELLRELADGLRALPAHQRPALHLFPFGGLAKLAAWRRHAMG
ncbi:MAG: methylenetetrahydrofolate reductase [Variibacter sp.]|nr:methylenetetrahydrofolate reductase [Variibacter sp.]